MVGLVFWASYAMLAVSLSMCLASHPLMVGGCVLFMYMFGSVLVSFSVSFVMGVFLFLTGVSGMMVAFLYVVALCPNPVFITSEGWSGYLSLVMTVVLVGFVGPFAVSGLSLVAGSPSEVMSLVDSFQWLRDPYMCGGLSELMPFLGFLLFLCMVSVVMLCGQQKQCLGGHMFGDIKRDYA